MRFRRTPSPAVEQRVAFPAAESPARPAPRPDANAPGAGHPNEYAPEPVPVSWWSECYPQWVGRSEHKPFISTDAACSEIAALHAENRRLEGLLVNAVDERNEARAQRDAARAQASRNMP